MSDPEQRRNGLAELRAHYSHAGVDVSERASGGLELALETAHPERPAAHARHERTRADDAEWVSQGGEMGGRIRAYDWAATPLGPIEQWPACLRNALDLILRSPVPMNISWGERGILLYNDAMVPMLGVHHPHVLGVSSLEAWPAHSKWMEGLLRQVLAGQSLSLHDQRLETRRSGMREQAWFDLDCSPILDEHGHPRGMLQVVSETTAQIEAQAHREKLEANLRTREARQRFVLAFTDRVRNLADPQAVMSEAVTALGGQLEAARCGYADIGSNMQALDVRAEWTDAAQASGLGVQSMADSSEAVRATFLAGKTFVVNDADNDARETVRGRAAKYLAWGARAVVAAPLIHNGRWVALLYVADARPRTWSPDEVALIEEMAARIWEAVERARAEAALRENEARFRALFEAVPSAVLVCDRDGVIQHFNARAVEIWGRAPIRGIDRRGATRLWHGGDELPLGQSPAIEVLQGAPAQHDLDITIGRPDGARVPVQMNISPLRNPRGEITGAIISFSDVSERKRREAHLALLADIAEVTGRCDDEAQIMQTVSSRIGAYLNLHCCCLISIDEASDSARTDQVWYEGAIPKLPRSAPLSSFVVPAFSEEAHEGKPLVVRDCHTDARTDGDAYARYEVGSFITIPWHIAGVWRGLLAFCDDAPRDWREDEIELVCEVANRILPRIERARAQAALAASEAHLRQMIDALPTAIYTTDARGRVTHFNPAAVEFAGRVPQLGSDEWCVSWKLYRADGSVLPHDQCPMAIALKQDRAIYGGIEAIAERPDGSRRWFMPYPTPLHDAQGKLIGGINMLVDITQRKHDEQALQDAHTQTQAQRRLYEAILDNTPDIAYVFDLDHRFTYANKALLKMWGKTADETIGKTARELGYPEWHAAMQDREIEQVIASKLPVRGQVPFTGAFGERIYEYIFVPVLGPHGEVEAVAGTTRDITEQKEVERALRAQEERQSFLLALGDQLRAVADPDAVQRVACEALGHRLDCDRVYFVEILQDEGRAIVLPDYHRPGIDSIAGTHDLAGMRDFLAGLRDDQPLVLDDVAQASLPAAARELLAALNIGALAATLLVKQGKLAWALVAADAQPREWRTAQVALLTEVAERTWEAVERSRSNKAAGHLAAIVTSSHDAIVSKDLGGIITSWNQGAERLFGYTTEEAVGHPITILMPPERVSEEPGILARIRAGDSVDSFETVRRHKDGRLLDVSLMIAPIRDTRGQIVGASKIARDIGDRKRDELLLSEQKQVLEHVAAGCELSLCLQELSDSVSRFDAGARGCVVLADGALAQLRDSQAAFLPPCFEDSSGAHVCELAAGISEAAISSGQPLDCEDIASDPRWPQAWREKCLADGVRACHATPIFDSQGKPIGSFFLSLNRVGRPGTWHRRLAEFGARIATLVMERHLAERAVRQGEADLAKELADTRLLQRVSTELVSETDPDALYSRIVDAAASLMRSDMASLQMVYPERGAGGELRLLAHRGFSEEAAAQWAWVSVGCGTACDIALRQGKRVIIKDVRECETMLGAHGLAAYERADIRAVQTTPLYARNGKLVGMLSTHWREPREPSPRRLGLLEVLGRQAADLIEGRRAEQKLVELNNFLERRVVERTQELAASERDVRRMASQLTMAEHAERRRISQILHDDLQQQLHSIQMKLASARNALGRGDDARTLRHLCDAEQWSGEGVETARRLTVDLSPPILKSEGLAEALDWLVTQMREMHGLKVSVGGDRDLQMHDDAKRVLIYQIVRELLFNIVKHAGIDEARIELRRHDDMLDVCVLDEGSGFDPATLRHPKPRSGGGFGLTSAYERLNLLGGGIEVDSAPGIGTSIVLHVPIHHAYDEASQMTAPADTDSSSGDLFH